VDLNLKIEGLPLDRVRDTPALLALLAPKDPAPAPKSSPSDAPDMTTWTSGETLATKMIPDIKFHEQKLRYEKVGPLVYLKTGSTTSTIRHNERFFAGAMNTILPFFGKPPPGETPF
jgi:hypothetical protein